jgi:para-aminobenzoate synthetase/4-amino-4-deoxychorismate lyase
VQVDELFAVEKFRTLFQMTSTIHGQLRPGLSFYEVFRALFPCGSIVGAPKVRTMQIIDELEQRPRGIYTGAIGFIAPNRESVFSVAIRTLVLQDGVAGMGVGSGLVYDSDPAAEYEECRLKAGFLSPAISELQLIETMLWDREYFLLAEHLERLQASAAYFDFECDPERVALSLKAFAFHFAPGSRHRVRLLLDRDGLPLISASLLPENSPAHLLIEVASERVKSDNLFLRHKTTERDLYDRVLKKAQSSGFDDALFLNERDEVVEGAIHNIFIVKNGQWLTPPLRAGCLPGVFRQHLLKTQPDVHEQTLTLEDLRSAEEIFLCNSVRGLRQVGSIVIDGNTLFSDNSQPNAASPASFNSH